MTLRQEQTYERALRLHNLAAKCQSEGNPVRPEKLYLRSLALKRQLFGPDHIEAGLTLNNLGLYYKSLGRLAEARDAYQRALAILQRELGGAHASVGNVVYNLAQLYRKESEALETRAQLIRESQEALADPSWREKARVRPEFAHYRLHPGPSRIHRFGLFAGEAIPERVDIIEYTGQRVSRRGWAERDGKQTYMFRLNRYWCIDGAVGGSGAELINHCCEPNARFRVDRERVWVSSLKPVESGQELLLDYRYPKGSNIPCYCGAPSCRGTINLR